MANKEPDKKKENEQAQASSVPTISREEWDKINEKLAAVDTLIQTVQSQRVDLEILQAAADKNRVAQIKEKLKTPGNSIVKLRTMRKDGEVKVIVGWATLKNDSYIDPLTKREVADQRVDIIFEDDTHQVERHNDFDRLSREQMVLAEVISQNGPVYKVKTIADGKEYTLDVAVLN